MVDGGSTDGTVGVIEAYAKKFVGRLRWVSEKDSGIYNAMNKGVSMARGEFLSVIGAGDWLEKDALKNAQKCIVLNPDVEAVYGKTRVWEIGGGNRMVQTFVQDLPNHPMQHPALFYKKTLHEKFGKYEEKYTIVADYAFCLKALYQGEAKTKSFEGVVANFVMDGVSSEKSWQCVKEGMEAKKSVGISVNFLGEVLGWVKSEMKRGIAGFLKKDGFLCRRLFMKKEEKYKPLRLGDSAPPPAYAGLRLGRGGNKDTLPLCVEGNKDVPVFVISFNRLKYLKKLIAWLEWAGFENIHIVDNASTYPPLLEYLKTLKHTVHRMEKNYGHLVVWECGRFDDILRAQRYIVTDSDVVPISECPFEVMNYFSEILARYPGVTKVGFGLKIDDLPDTYAQRDLVLEWEEQFWKKKKAEGLYDASIDTTFALYRPGIFPTQKKWWKSIRTDFPYLARHLPWYEDSSRLDEEDMFYQKNIQGRSSFWSVTDISLLKKYNRELINELTGVYASREWKCLQLLYGVVFFFSRSDRFKKKGEEKECLLKTLKKNASVLEWQKRNGEIVSVLGSIYASGGWRMLKR